MQTHVDQPLQAIVDTNYDRTVILFLNTRGLESSVLSDDFENIVQGVHAAFFFEAMRKDGVSIPGFETKVFPRRAKHGFSKKGGVAVSIAVEEASVFQIEGEKFDGTVEVSAPWGETRCSILGC
jgi:hypothetical protein